jgi:cytochrome P450
VGIVPEFRKRGPVLFYRDLWRKYGEVVRFPFLGFPLPQAYRYLIAAPDLVHQILVRDQQSYSRETSDAWVVIQYTGKSVLVIDGDRWRLRRRLLQPAFKPGPLARYCEVCLQTSQEELSTWPTDTVFDMKRALTNLALKNLCGALFGTDLARKEREELRLGTDAISRYFSDLLLSGGIPLPLWMPTKRNRQAQQAVRRIHAAFDRMLAFRRTHPQQGPDLLSILLTSQEKEQLSDRQIHDELMTMFLAGHETTATALAWTLYFLSQDQAVERRVQEEVDQVLKGHPPSGERLPQLKYTRMVLDEALRLYPPAMGTTRRALTECELGGYHIPKNALLWIDYSILQRRPDIWGEEADLFRPERFAEQRGGERSAYLPFTRGPHRCIGEDFALSEAVMI